MSISTSKIGLLGEIDRLTPRQQEQLLKVARIMTHGDGTSVSRMLQFAGSIPQEDLREMAAAIEEGCERVDSNAW